MQKIEALEESKLLAESNPSESSLKTFIETLIEETNNDIGHQTYYCERVIDYFFHGPSKSHLVDELRKNLYKLEPNDFDDEFNRLVLVLMGLWYLEAEDYGSIQGVLIDWETIVNKNSQYYCLNSRYMIQQMDENFINTGIEDAFRAKEQSNSSYFLYNIAHILWFAIDNGYQYTGDNKNIPSTTSSMIELADDMIETAINQCSENIHFHIIKAKISIQKSKWNEAEAAIRQGNQMANSRRDDYNHIFFQLQLLEYELQSRKRRNNIRKEFSTFEKITDQLDEEISRLSNNIENASGEIQEIDTELQNNKTKFLQFLGFFAALLAVVVTSTQVIVTSTDFSTAMRLISGLTGSLLIAFGGFSTLFLRSDNPYGYMPTLYMTLLGSGLMILAFSL